MPRVSECTGSEVREVQRSVPGATKHGGKPKVLIADVEFPVPRQEHSEK